MKTRLLSFLCFLLMSLGIQAHNLDPLHVDGRYLKNPQGDIVTLHGWIAGGNIFGITNFEDYEANVKACEQTIDSILAVGYKVNCARLHFGGERSPEDFDGFVQRGTFERVHLPLIDYLNSKGIYVLLMADVCAEEDHQWDVPRTIGESWQQRLLKYWNYVSSHPRIKNNPGVMFELQNEPNLFQGSDGSMNDFRTLKAYYQPMVDLIRQNGCQQVIYVSGWGCQEHYAGYATFPVEGTNIGFAVHSYDWNRSKDYTELWEKEMKVVSNMAPIIVTEIGWEGRYGLSVNGDGTKPENPPLTSDFGMNLKQIYDEMGNVSWICLSGPEKMVLVGNNPSKPTEYNDPEGPYMATYEWFNEYDKTKITKMSSLQATKVELQDIHHTVYPGDVRPITLMATFSDGRRWNVAGDAVWTSSDESVLYVEQGDLYVKAEGKVTVNGVYTDGSGKSFQISFDVTSQLFPLTADGFLIRSGGWEEFTYTGYLWDFGGEVHQQCASGVWTWNQRGGLDFSSYKYLVMRMNEPFDGSTRVQLYDQVGATWNREAKVSEWPEGTTEAIIDLHGYPNFDPSHVTSVAIETWRDPISIKEIFLSNDGVNPAPPYTMPTLVTADDVMMFYGDDVPELTYSVSGYGNVGTPKLTTTATKTSPVGTYDILISGSAEGVTYKPGKLIIAPAPLIVTANDVIVGKGKDIPVLTLSYDGLRNGDTVDNALSEQPTATTTATKDSPYGNYEITVSGGKAPNYKLALRNGTLTITPDATISLPADRTAKVATSTEAWGAWGESFWATPTVTTADGRTVSLVDRYENTATTMGKVMEQTVTGLESGEYTVELCANAFYTDGRGFGSDIKEGAKDVVELYANDMHQAMAAHIGGGTDQNDVYTLKDVKVSDGILTIGMNVLKAGTNWHTLQIKSLTLTKQYSLSESYNVALAEAKALLQQRMSERARNTLQEAIEAEQTYANLYLLADAKLQARKSIEAQAFAARALDVWQNEFLTATNVCTPEAKERFLQQYQVFKNAYDDEWLTDETALQDLYNPYEGGGGGAFICLAGFIFSAWEYNMDNTFYMEGAPYRMDGGINDHMDFIKPYIICEPADGKQTLDANTLKATMTDMEPGQYTVTVLVDLRRMDGSDEAPKGVTLQVCDGTAVKISGQRVGNTNDYVGRYVAQGTVGSDGVLTIKFHVSEDNNINWMAFRDLWQEQGRPLALGDLNSDGSVSITDVVLIIDVIAGTITKGRQVKAADVNQDGSVTITDCVAAIDLIAAPSKGARMNRATAMPVSTDHISGSLRDNMLTVNLDNENRYTAFQMVVSMPDGMTLDKASIEELRGPDHQLVVRNLGHGQYLVIGFSMDNNELTGNSGRLLTIVTNGQAKDDIVISNIEFVTTHAEPYCLSPISISGTETGISFIENSERRNDTTIYDLQGRRVHYPSRGLYIVNGGKKVVK